MFDLSEFSPSMSQYVSVCLSSFLCSMSFYDVFSTTKTMLVSFLAFALAKLHHASQQWKDCCSDLWSWAPLRSSPWPSSSPCLTSMCPHLPQVLMIHDLLKRFLLSLIFNWFQFVTRPLPVEWSDPSGRRRLKEIEFILFAFSMFSMFSMFRCKMVQKNNLNMWRHVKTFRVSTPETMLISLLQPDPRQLHWTSTGPWSMVTKPNQKVYGCLW